MQNSNRRGLIHYFIILKLCDDRPEELYTANVISKRPIVILMISRELNILLKNYKTHCILHRGLNFFLFKINLNTLIFQIPCITRNIIPLLENIANFKNLFERVIYVNCVLLAMSNNINILDNIKKYVILADQPSVGIVRGLPSVTLEILLKKFSKLLFFLGVGNK
ncbi:hypothetical protein NARC_150022 [Candidatus Nitrosocosmicus arcticus]|uniref:Uncharacterized protein n=2 Tax=Candidatus Nitrosocosmicus arcticus TaxID=2035267 RepID=A0A557SS62_9ARCH|nr:hypothetical protein NARC_150022 [Candidatus Nitrosocosmicus arcticus]